MATETVWQKANVYMKLSVLLNEMRYKDSHKEKLSAPWVGSGSITVSSEVIA